MAIRGFDQLKLMGYIRPGFSSYELDLTPEQLKEQKKKLRLKKLKRIFK